jgi:hypothetical protein
MRKRAHELNAGSPQHESFLRLRFARDNSFISLVLRHSFESVITQICIVSCFDGLALFLENHFELIHLSCYYRIIRTVGHLPQLTRHNLSEALSCGQEHPKSTSPSLLEPLKFCLQFPLIFRFGRLHNVIALPVAFARPTRFGRLPSGL